MAGAKIKAWVVDIFVLGLLTCLRNMWLKPTAETFQLPAVSQKRLPVILHCSENG